MQRILAAAGVASRRAAEEWIRAGRVTVNGRVGTLGERADPARDVVCVDGERLTPEPLAYWIVHKPRGVVTTVRDPEGRPTILSLLPEAAGRLYPVGRLDRDTEGLVLLTNDGPLTHALLHPSHEIEREYVVRARGAMREGALRRLAEGIVLDDGPTAPAGVERVEVEERFTTFHLTVIEGRKRQIRRALEALGHPVLGLCRIRMGPLVLGRLAAGEARVLATHDRRRLLRATGLASPRTRKSGSKKARGKGKPGASRKPRK
ncbi:MAG: pseudouridine synthase [Myxococcota bacterium]